MPASTYSSASLNADVRQRNGPFRRITKRDDPKRLAESAARYEALLGEALVLAKRKAKKKPREVSDILATTSVEGLASRLRAKAAAITYRVSKLKCTWHSLLPWQYLEDTTTEEQALSMLDTVERNLEMTKTDSWPKPPPARTGRRAKK